MWKSRYADSSDEFIYRSKLNRKIGRTYRIGTIEEAYRDKRFKQKDTGKNYQFSVYLTERKSNRKGHILFNCPTTQSEIEKSDFYEDGFISRAGNSSQRKLKGMGHKIKTLKGILVQAFGTIIPYAIVRYCDPNTATLPNKPPLIREVTTMLHYPHPPEEVVMREINPEFTEWARETFVRPVTTRHWLELTGAATLPFLIMFARSKGIDYGKKPEIKKKQ